MPEQEPTPWELMRAVNRVEKLVVDMNLRLDRLVSMDLFMAHQRETDRRFSEAAEDMVRLRDARRADNEKRDRQRLLVVGAIATAVFTFISSVFLQLVDVSPNGR